jgi:hypothetical protein
VRVHYGEGVAIRIGPEPCVGIREGVGEASVGERIGQPLSRESKKVSGADVVINTEGNMDGASSQAPAQPDVVEDPGMCGRSLCGTGRSRVWPAGEYRGSASGRRGVEADDARTREV